MSVSLFDWPYIFFYYALRPVAPLAPQLTPPLPPTLLCRAEVLSADAFGAFEDAGLADDAAVAATGRRFAETVLALGGGRAPADVFADFRGRAPSVEPLLRHSGLLPATA